MNEQDRDHEQETISENMSERHSFGGRAIEIPSEIQDLGSMIPAWEAKQEQKRADGFALLVNDATDGEALAMHCVQCGHSATWEIHTDERARGFHLFVEYDPYLTNGECTHRFSEWCAAAGEHIFYRYQVDVYDGEGTSYTDFVTASSASMAGFIGMQSHGLEFAPTASAEARRLEMVVTEEDSARTLATLAAEKQQQEGRKEA